MDLHPGPFTSFASKTLNSSSPSKPSPQFLSASSEILQRIQDGVAVVDHSGALLWFNGALDVISDGEPEEFCLEALRLAPRSWRAEGNAHVTWTLNGEAADEAIEITAQPMPLQPTCDLLIFRDMTEKRRLERRLFESERQATFGLLAASVGHEINNVLVGLVGYSELVQGSLNDHELVREVFENHSQQCERLRQLTEDFLALSRPHEEELTDLDLAHELHTTVGMLSHTGRFRECHFRVSVRAGMPMIRGDRVEIRQLLINLMLQAAERLHSSGEISVTLGLSECGALLELMIEDNGGGAVRAPQGTGLDPFLPLERAGVNGLSELVTQRIAERHGAALHSETIADQGNRMRLLFPYG